MRVNPINDQLIKRPRKVLFLAGLGWGGPLVREQRRLGRSDDIIKGLRARDRRAQLEGARRRRLNGRICYGRKGRGQVRRRPEKTNNGRVPVVQLRHRIEEMRDKPRPVAHSSSRYLRSSDTEIRQRSDNQLSTEILTCVLWNTPRLACRARRPLA